MIHGLILFPPGFDAAAAAPGSLPVVEQIYAGPHGAHVPKDWGAQRSARELAALGFAGRAVRRDGDELAEQGVPRRLLARPSPTPAFPTAIAWIRAAAERFPALDLSRVGIYGGSAGGQNAMRAVLDHADFYRAAAADCGCHDNRVDKLWWNEAWLGEYGPHYWESSNALDAANLGGALLLTVGGLDRNVDPISTMQVCDAPQRRREGLRTGRVPPGRPRHRRERRGPPPPGGILRPTPPALSVPHLPNLRPPPGSPRSRRR